MKIRIKRIGVVSVLVLGAYFAAYYLAVRTMEYNNEHDLIVPAPVYWPSDNDVVRAAFEPAYLIDAAYIRRGHWEPRSVPRAR